MSRSRVHRRVFAWLTGLYVCAAWLAAAEPSPAPAAHDAAPGIILISIDTLRPDHLGVYGYSLPTTPSLDRFSKDAVKFATAISQAPSTLPSHASIFTSLIPAQHGALLKRRSGLDPAHTTLAEVLRSAGYRTFAFHGGGQMAPQFGLGQGFEAYEEITGPFGAAVEQAKKWLEKNASERFFLFLHTYAVHHPYTPRPETLRLFDPDYRGPLPDSISIELLEKINRHEIEVTPRDVEHIQRAYDAEIRDMDESFGELIAWLEQKKLYDRTVIVFTSDHGEEFGERGLVGWHGRSLHDELLRVPLLIKLPRSERGGTVVSRMVRSIDIAPTVVDLAGLPEPSAFTGTSLESVMQEDRGPAAEAVSQRDMEADPLVTSVRTERWKLYRGGLFDLESDPGELRPVPGSLHRDVRALLEASRLRAETTRGSTTETVKIEPRVKDQLRALGYAEPAEDTD